MKTTQWPSDNLCDLHPEQQTCRHNRLTDSFKHTGLQHGADTRSSVACGMAMRSENKVGLYHLLGHKVPYEVTLAMISSVTFICMYQTSTFITAYAQKAL